MKFQIVATRKWDSLVSTDFRSLLYLMIFDGNWQLKHPSDCNYRFIQLYSQNKWIIKVFALTDLKWMRCRNQKRPFTPYLVNSSSLFEAFFLHFYSQFNVWPFLPSLFVCVSLSLSSSIYFSIQWILFISVRFS